MVDIEKLSFLDYIHNGVIIVDKDLNIVFWNKWLEFKTYIKKDEILGESLADNFNYINEDELKRKVKFVINFKQQSFYTVEPHKFLIDIYLNNITNRVFELMQQNIILAPFEFDGNDKDYVIIHIYDVTELEAAKQKLQTSLDDIKSQQEMLANQSRLAAMGEMIANISHQWKQPLSTLSYMIQKLQFKPIESIEDSDNLVKKALPQIDYLANTIEDFRTFFMEEKENHNFNIKDAIDSTMSIVAKTLENKQINIKILASDDYVLYGKQNTFAQVIINILNNAKDALVSNHIENKTVIIKYGQQDNVNYLSIEDNAGGIPNDVLPKIFEPYFTTKFKDQGTGIGLYMSKMIVENQMGGLLEALNSTNGAIFKIEFKR